MTSHIATQEESLVPAAKVHGERILNVATERSESVFEQTRTNRARVSYPQATGFGSSVAELVSVPKAKRPLQEQASEPGRLEKILQLLPSGVVILDSRGRICDCNQAAEELLDGKLKGSSWRDVIAANFHPRLDDGHEISLKNGKRISLATRSLGDEPGQLIVLNDLTETRELQPTSATVDNGQDDIVAGTPNTYTLVSRSALRRQPQVE